jgi:uncharacterized membrane protein YhaH (DUF805 family)
MRALIDKSEVFRYTITVTYFRRLFHGRINKQSYIVGGVVNLLCFIIVDYPLIEGLLAKFSLTVQNLGLFLLICVQVFYQFSFDIRRGHDIGVSKDSIWGQDLLYWEYYSKNGEKRDNKYGHQPKPGIDIKGFLFGVG